MEKAMIGIVMGSDSDWPVMKEAAEVLNEFGVTWMSNVVSAHRTPDLMASFGKEARNKGFHVIIAGAGGAAHLPGMLASHTTLPVIGVPIPTKDLGGLDSLYSIVQMPNGIPVATVGIGKAKNAALLALRIVSIHDESIAKKLSDYHQKMADESMKKTAFLKL